jgi:predicted phage terminase large subunit-like protein
VLDYKLELDLKKEIFKNSYFEFFKWTFSILFPNERYEDNFHVKFLCDLYQAEIERIIRKEEKDKDIIVNIPPRTSKSLITSVCLLPWMWIKDPTLPMISVSFDEELSLVNAQLSKDIIKNPEYQEMFPDVQIRHDMDSKSLFQNTKGGFRLSKTTGANITGHKGVVIVVDDPQNPLTAEQEVERKKATLYYTRSLFNRLTPERLGVRIIIMQRLHEEDLTGYLLKHHPEDYNHICLPAEESKLIKPASLKQFYKNGLLDIIRLGKITLASFRKVLGSRGYSGQYEQTPSPAEGGIIKKVWFDIVDPATLVRDPINEPICFFIDSAYTEKTENDPTVIMAGFLKDNIFYVLDVNEEWLEFPKLCAHIIAYTARFQYNEQSRIYIEPKASGKSVKQQLMATTKLNVIETEAPDKDKVTRAHAVTPKLESGRVKLVRGHYIEDYLTQLAAFPNASHDDKVDVTVIAVNEMLIGTEQPDFFFIQ